MLDLVLVRWEQSRYLDLAAAGENILSLLPEGVLEPWRRPDQETFRERPPAGGHLSGSFMEIGAEEALLTGPAAPGNSF